MSTVGDQLSEWQAAGLLDAESCARIAQYEQAKKPAGSAQPVLIELFAYLGLIIVGAGVVVLVAVNWDQLGGVARIATLAVPGIALLPLGRLLSTSREPGLRRGGSIAWLLALTLVTGAVGVTGHELAWGAESAVLAGGIVALAFAFVLWWFNRDHAQVVGLAAAAVLLSIGAAAFDARYLSDANTATLLGLALLTQFGLGSVFVRLGALTPRNTAGVLALYGLAAGAVLVSVGLGMRFDGDHVVIAIGTSLLFFGALGIAVSRLGLLVPALLAGVLSQIAFAVATLYFAVGIAGALAPAGNEAAMAGMVIVALGAALAVSAELSAAVPRSLARLVACLGLVVGAIAAAAPDGWVAAEPAPLVVGSVLVFLSLRGRTFVYMAGGLVALFMGLVLPVARHVSDPTVAAIMMIVIGLMLLGALVMLVRVRPWSGGPTPPQTRLRRPFSRTATRTRKVL